MALKIVAVGEIPSPDDGDLVGVLLAGDWDAVREAAKLFGEEVVVFPRPAGEVREGWRPIETAPQDGTEIDVWTPDGREAAVSCQGGRWCKWGLGGFETMEWVPLYAEPTHWMPLPTPPEGERG